ncbi:MAG TPA: DUF2911 domain-containing protein [Terriglobales bacterium]|nr:DUF2911 domain-containing protein [Terriglobales bacterium]
MIQRPISVLLFGVLMAAMLCQAQSVTLDIPRQSQHAVVTQRIGITDITINYHRPLAGSRKIWGAVVPYGQVWRAGANENTTISFSDPVTIEGKPLDKGTYGLFMIPAEDQWTVILSKNSTSWGAFTYKEAEDALRVTVKPQSSDPQNALAYDFDQVKPDSTVITMRWEKVAVPFTVGVNVNQIVADSLHKQLRGLAQYTWDGWNDAGTYLVMNKGDLQEALKYEDQSIQVEERFENLSTKARVLDALGRKDEARATLAKAFEKGSPLQIHGYARQLQGENKQDEAFAIFRSNAQKHPDQWFTHVGLARVYSGQGDFNSAVKEVGLALNTAPDQQKDYLKSLMKRLEAKDDINR